MQDQKPEELFDRDGGLVPELKGLAQREPPHERQSPCQWWNSQKGSAFAEFLITLSRSNGPEPRGRERPAIGGLPARRHEAEHEKFPRVRPGQTTSNKLQAIYEVTKKFWIAEYFPEDEEAANWRLMDASSRCSASTRWKGCWKVFADRPKWLHSSYEAFVHVIDSMFNQHAKWLSICNHLSWRRKIASLEPPDHFDGLAAGPQRLHTPGSGFPRRCRE